MERLFQWPLKRTLSGDVTWLWFWGNFFAIDGHDPNIIGLVCHVNNSYVAWYSVMSLAFLAAVFLEYG